MSFLSNAGRGLIRWTPKIVKASADDIEMFGPQAAQVRALLNFIPTMSDDAAEISGAARRAARDATRDAQRAASDAARNEARVEAWNEARSEATDVAWDAPWYDAARYSTLPVAADSARDAARSAAETEVVSDLITPEVYRVLTNPTASARALDRLAGRAPESFVPIARDLGERGLVAAPSDIVSALRISKLPPHVQPLVTGLVDSGLTLEEAIAAARALS